VSIHGLPVIYALFVWWFSTGAVLYVIGMPARTFTKSMLAATVVLAASLWGIAVTAYDETVWGAYAAFTCGILVWGWHEMSFLTGLVTGPRRSELPDASQGLGRLVPAIETVIFHEIAIFLTVIALAALTWGAPNTIALWTFVILWLMRLSAKINVYLGVPNLTEEFLPPHLTYLKTYFRRRPMNLFFPVTVTVSTVVTGLLVAAALHPTLGAPTATGLTFLATLMALAVLEHWFLVLPIPAAAMWAWGMSSRTRHHGEPSPQATGRVPTSPIVKAQPDPQISSV
jgi:putative photosynthetic complex assembly protein 2